MPSHFSSKKHNIVSGSSPVATKVPQAAGLAFAIKYRQKCGLVCYNPDASSAQTGKAHYDILREIFVHFQERVGINHSVDHIPDIVRLVGVFGNDIVQFRALF